MLGDNNLHWMFYFELQKIKRDLQNHVIIYPVNNRVLCNCIECNLLLIIDIIS